MRVTLKRLLTYACCFRFAGVKEAFLKIAQGVITLFQKNRHNPPVGSRLDVDMSLEGSTDAEMSSHATRPTITKNIKRNAYFYTTRSNADYETSRTLSAGDHYYRERDRTISHVDGGTSKVCAFVLCKYIIATACVTAS